MMQRRKSCKKKIEDRKAAIVDALKKAEMAEADRKAAKNILAVVIAV